MRPIAVAVRRVSATGIISTVPNTGVGDFPNDLDVGPDGSLYIVHDNERVQRVAPDGTVTTVAGGGNPPDGIGDGLPATQAKLYFYYHMGGVAVGPDGSLYIAEPPRHSLDGRVRRVGPDGIIETFAGKGTPQSGLGDGGPATEAWLCNAKDVALGPDGSVYIAQSEGTDWRGPLCSRIRRVKPDGTITTVAGSDTWTAPLGDGGPAIAARLWEPFSIAVAPDGSVYISDLEGRLRRVGPDGIINTVAGLGQGSTSLSFNGDGIPAAQAQLLPHGLDIGPDGALYVASGANIASAASARPCPACRSARSPFRRRDGQQLYRFDFHGRHLRTLNALTGAPLYEFGYDGQGRLVTVTDGDGNVTTVERNARGEPTAIVAPFGQRTALTLDANGYFAGIANPAGETSRFTYTPDGLLTSRPTRGQHLQLHLRRHGPAGEGRRPGGRLQDPGAAGAAQGPDPRRRLGSVIDHRSRRTTRYRVETLNKGETRLTNTFPDGLSNTVVTGLDGSTIITYTDGMVMRMATGPPVLGMPAPVTNRAAIETPGGCLDPDLDPYGHARRPRQPARPGNPDGRDEPQRAQIRQPLRWRQPGVHRHDARRATGFREYRQSGTSCLGAGRRAGSATVHLRCAWAAKQHRGW